ncbi:MAG: polysaccharide biosynthesis protein [Ruminococcaceae bacterium]|nr:polysaccharide biosynthesis protein [Oscillospiraceae bacterium]
MVEAVNRNTQRTFFSGVLLLTLSTVLVKLIGLFYKIPMLSYLGTEGMGYFNSAYEIYALFCVISTAGLPVALSVLISGAVARGEDTRAARIYRVTRAVFWLIGIGGTLVMWFFADAFCHVIKSDNALFCMRAIAPTVFLVCYSSALRGYFQGYQRMFPTAFSQLLESIGKLLFGLLLARYALQKGLDTPVVAAYAGVGLTLGTAVSTGYLMIAKARFHPTVAEEIQDGNEEQSARGGILGQLCRLAIPMTLGASLVSLTKLVDMTMILRRLQVIGLDEVAANEAYGSYTTLALSVFGLIPALVNSVALPLVPMLSAAIASGDRARQAQMVRISYLLTSLFAIPAALGLSAFAKPILFLLFKNESAAVETAAPLLSYLGISVFLSCMITATNSVLHAYQVVNRPILSMLAGAVVKVISAYLLIGSPTVAMAGAPVSTFLCNVTVVLLNLYFTASLCRQPSVKEVFLRPLGASVGAVGISLAAYLWASTRWGSGTLLTLSALLLTLALYLIFACLFGVFNEKDLSSIPLGKKMLSFWRKDDS